jgi:hypothetical protein
MLQSFILKKTVSTTLVANLPPAKFARSIKDTGPILPPVPLVLLISVANFPPVSTVPVENLLLVSTCEQLKGTVHIEKCLFIFLIIEGITISHLTKL